MRRGLAPLVMFLLTAATVAAGCTGLGPARLDPTENEPSGCGGEDVPSQNAPVLDLFTQAPVEGVKTFSNATGDPVEGAKPNPDLSQPGALTWDTESGGTLTVHMQGGSVVAFNWTGGDDVAREDGRAWLNETLEDLGASPGWFLPVEERRENGTLALLFQEGVEGKPLMGTAGFLQPEVPRLVLQPVFNLTGAEVNLTYEDAEELARARLRCELDHEGHTEAAGYEYNGTADRFLSVMDQSLAYGVLVNYTSPAEDAECPLMFAVYVDAATGAHLGYTEIPCERLKEAEA